MMTRLYLWVVCAVALVGCDMSNALNLPKGYEVVPYHNRGDWWEIKTNGVSAWVPISDHVGGDFKVSYETREEAVSNAWYLHRLTTDIYADVPDEVVARMGVHRGPPTPEDIASTNIYVTNTYPSEVALFPEAYDKVSAVLIRPELTNDGWPLVNPAVTNGSIIDKAYHFHQAPDAAITSGLITNIFIESADSYSTITFTATHKPTLSHSNNVWIIRFEP